VDIILTNNKFLFLKLYKLYSSEDPPPCELLRIPQVLDLLIDAVFKPTQQINREHKFKYIYLLAFAACVHEHWQDVSCTVNSDDPFLSQLHLFFFQFGS